MPAVWLRATFLRANSSSPSRQRCHPCSLWELEDVRRREKDELYKFLPFTPLLSFTQQQTRMAQLCQRNIAGSPSAPGTPDTSHPAVTSTNLCHLTLSSSSSDPQTFSHLLPGWTGEGTYLQQRLRQRDQETEKKNPKIEIISPEPAAAPHGFLPQVLDIVSASPPG